MKLSLQILPKSRLGDLVKEVDSNLVLEEEVEELLLNYVDEFIDRVLKGACMIAKHRQDSTIEVKDVQQFLSMRIVCFVLNVKYLVIFQIATTTCGHLDLELMS